MIKGRNGNCSGGSYSSSNERSDMMAERSDSADEIYRRRKTETCCYPEVSLKFTTSSGIGDDCRCYFGDLCMITFQNPTEPLHIHVKPKCFLVQIVIVYFHLYMFLKIRFLPSDHTQDIHFSQESVFETQENRLDAKDIRRRKCGIDLAAKSGERNRFHLWIYPNGCLATY